MGRAWVCERGCCALPEPSQGPRVGAQIRCAHLEGAAALVRMVEAILEVVASRVGGAKWQGCLRATPQVPAPPRVKGSFALRSTLRLGALQKAAAASTARLSSG